MPTVVPPGWNLAGSTVWGTDVDRTSSGSGGYSLEFKNTVPGYNPALWSDYIPIDGGVPLIGECLWNSDSTTAANKMKMIVYKYTFALTGSGSVIIMNIATDNILQYKRDANIVDTDTSDSYIRIYIEKVGANFTGKFANARVVHAPMAFRAYGSSATTIATASNTQIEFDDDSTSPNYDYGSVFDTGNYEFVAKRGGLWHFSWGVEMAGFTAPNRFRTYIATDTGGGYNAHTSGHDDATGQSAPLYTGSADTWVDRGDKVAIFGYHDDGVNRNTAANSTDCWFAGHEIRGF